jgi:hypothetical protein
MRNASRPIHVNAMVSFEVRKVERALKKFFAIYDTPVENL